MREALLILEVRIRSKAQRINADYGLDLVVKAFRPDTGILTDKAAERAEQQGLFNMIQGAFGHLRNPVSHRHAGTEPVRVRSIHAANRR